MPCDAIAVAKGQVKRSLARELEGLGTEAVVQALLALLRQRFVHLGQPQLVSLWGAYSGARASGIGIRLGHVLVRISPQWQVTVNTRRASLPGDDETVQRHTLIRGPQPHAVSLAGLDASRHLLLISFPITRLIGSHSSVPQSYPLGTESRPMECNPSLRSADAALHDVDHKYINKGKH